MNKLHRTKALCGIMAALCLGSCISTTNELDLNKDISFDMQIGSNGVKIPLGSLKKIYVDSLVNKSKDSVLVALEDGLFGFSKDGEIKKVNVDINDVKITSLLRTLIPSQPILKLLHRMIFHLTFLRIQPRPLLRSVPSICRKSMKNCPSLIFP